MGVGAQPALSACSGFPLGLKMERERERERERGKNWLCRIGLLVSSIVLTVYASCCV